MTRGSYSQEMVNKFAEEKTKFYLCTPFWGEYVLFNQIQQKTRQ